MIKESYSEKVLFFFFFKIPLQGSMCPPKHIPACRSVFELTRYFLGCNFLHTLTGIFTIDSNKNQHLFRPCLHTKWGISGLSIFFVKNLNAEETLCTKFSICVLSTSPLKLTYQHYQHPTGLVVNSNFTGSLDHNCK